MTQQLRFHEAPHRSKFTVAASGATVELISAGAEVWTRGQFRPGSDTLTFLLDGPAYGFQNRGDGSAPQAVGAAGWIRLLPADMQIHSERPPGHWTYLLISFPGANVCGPLALDFRTPRLHGVLTEIAGCMQSATAEGRPEAQIEPLLARLVRDLRVSRIEGRPDAAREVRRLPDWRVMRAANHVECDLGESLSVSEMAEVAGLRRSHFSRVFLETVGVSPHQYVLERRLLRARDALVASGRSVTTIAHEYGFSNAAHFATLFGRRFGRRPSDCLPRPDAHFARSR